ncbi:hypothetical protein M408DRAFT_26314 [Serendipita vermifera MAFF 305830]|uniref:F-box domain-containing protein n=1 Tax=Serendipita vermifera MAFF 305830 TaxID=933852 RepID=A0A0C2X7T5_SERVB|nr:hypothetical protein M408DRAFT_26314 [Serendipita vermifera MAFF 305830]
MSFFKVKNDFATRIFGTQCVKRTKSSPIQRVPFEILSEIFIIYSKEEVLASMKISSVCRFWRETILATPLAWTYICGAGIEETRISVEQYSRLLERSHPHPLFGKVDHVLEFRLHRESLTGGDELCACPKLKRIFEYSDRLRCLSIDCSWLTEEYPTLLFPNLEHLTLLVNLITKKLDMSRFPKLWHLRIPNCPFGITQLDFANQHRPQLRYLEIIVSFRDFWTPVSGMFASSLVTFILSGYVITGQRSERDIELPQLQSLIIYDDDVDKRENSLLVLSVPRLNYLEHRSRQKPLPSGLVRDHRELVHMRTNHLPRLCDYPSLRILQVEDSKCNLLLDISVQLESDSTVCPELNTIEAKFNEAFIYPRIYVYNVQKRIRSRNEKAGSNITLITCQKWPTIIPIGSHEVKVKA